MSTVKGRPERPWVRKPSTQPQKPKEPDEAAKAAAAAAAEAAQAAAQTRRLAERGHFKPEDAKHPNLFVRMGMPIVAAMELEEAGVSQPTVIQSTGIPAVLTLDHCALLAETGSGKTLAYTLPIMAAIYARSARAGGGKEQGHCCPAAIFVAPTRELAMQVAAVARSAANYCAPEDADRPLVVHTLLGKERGCLRVVKKGPKSFVEADNEEDVREFEAADVLVTTPLRMRTFFNAGVVRSRRLRHLVLDEADELMSEGYWEDVRALTRGAIGRSGLNAFGDFVQLVVVAATLGRTEWDDKVKPLLPAGARMTRVATPRLHGSPEALRQVVRRVTSSEDRYKALVEVLQDEQAGLPAMVFASEPAEADEIARKLVEDGVPAGVFHGRADSRGEALDEFMRSELAVLVCTDLAARGLDVPTVRHVVQWRPADTVSLHLHRVGRTARAGQEGPFLATALVDPEEDAARGATQLLLEAESRGWEAMGELINTRRSADAQ